MSEVGSAIEEVRSAIAGAASEFMPDLCDIQSTTPGSDDWGAPGQTPTTVAANIPCKYRALSSSERAIAGGTTGTVTHEITMPVTAATLAIKQHYRIRVLANGIVPEMIFDSPFPQLGAMEPFLNVYANLRMV